MARQYDRLRLTRVPAKYGPLMHRYPYLTSYPFRSQLDLMTDIPRLRMGMMGGQFWHRSPPPSMSEIKQSFLCRSVYVPCETGAPPVQKTMNQIDVVYQLAEVSKLSPDKIRLF